MSVALSVVLPLAVAVFGSLAIEAAGAQRRIGLRADDLAIRLASYALITVFWFAFSWRPWQAAVTCLGTVLTTVLVDRLKRQVIGEPLVFSDVALLGQVPRHPELYYTTPLTDPRAAGPLMLLILVASLWYALEPSLLPDGAAGKAAAIAGLPIALIGLGLLARSRPARALLSRRFPEPDLDADVLRYGVLATMIAYLLRRDSEADQRGDAPSLEPRQPVVGGGDDVVVVVQLESFLDPRRLGAPPLPLLERVAGLGSQFGRLRVPAHGAYTMRTEHAVITGHEGRDLGFGCFDPYLAGGGHDPTSLARLAAAAGYETVFIHPYHRDFFNRAGVMRALGFQRLVMEEEFRGAPRVGPYVSDAFVAERVLAEVRARRGKILCFCVTMENHGPWKAGRLPGIDDPLSQYLYHIGNTGRAAETLIDGLGDMLAERETATLCLFGDHPPSLPCYRPGDGDPSTDYAIVGFGPHGSVTPAAPGRIELSAAGLGRRLRDTLSSQPDLGEAATTSTPRS